MNTLEIILDTKVKLKSRKVTSFTKQIWSNKAEVRAERAERKSVLGVQKTSFHSLNM